MYIKYPVFQIVVQEKNPLVIQILQENQAIATAYRSYCASFGMGVANLGTQKTNQFKGGTA